MLLVMIVRFTLSFFPLNPDKVEMEIRELRVLENEIYLAKSGTRNDENC
jgi:hypothetical protein